MNATPSTPPTMMQAWVLAARPKTLPAAAAPVVLAAALAFYDGVFRLGPALAALAGALLLQIGANLANDLFDYQKGVDTHERLGPLRVTQAGLLTPRQMWAGMAVVFGAAALVGLYLAWAGGWPVIVIGVLSILAALAYTGGPYPLGYHGLGEVFVFLFFGLAAVMGTYYVQAQTVTWGALAAAIPMGLLSVGILVVNNLRDLATDRASGKHSLAVRFGEAWTVREYQAALWGAFLVLPAAALAGALPWAALAGWLAAPLAWRWSRFVAVERGRKLNLALAGTGQLELIFALLAGAGLALGRLWAG